MAIKHKDRAHALLSASGAERWINCPPSARLAEQFPDETSTYAAEGTLAHELAECFLISMSNKDMLPKEARDALNLKFSKCITNEMHTDEMHIHASDYAKFVNDRCLELQKANGFAELKIEIKVDYSQYAPEGFGTVDAMVISDGILEIIDFKYGKGVEVSAEDNAQLKLYALGAYLEENALWDIKTIRMTIYQPRIDNVSISEIAVEELMEWANEVVKPASELAFEGKGAFNPGGHCRFCKAKKLCKARHDAYSQIIIKRENPILIAESKLQAILRNKPLIEKWLADVEAFAIDKLLNGEFVEGFKLVEGRSQRKYSDGDAVVAKLKELNVPEAMIYKKELIGITEAEKLVGKKNFKEAFSNLIVKPVGKPTLALISDKRPAMQLDNVIDEFEILE